ncbi:Cadherin domain-containing protein [Fibrobacter sp. UWB10]|nr:Cadherin domain-containing protein [Fibrobacter sp. UWB10]
MWFGKKKLINLAIALAMSVPALAADLEPFHFANAGSSHDAQQAFWNNLMKYKVFGAHGITFLGGEIFVTDSSGWFGTADGNFDMGGANKKHTIGGPVLIGGKIILSNGQDTLSTGPVLVTGGIEKSPVASWDAPNVVKGTQCLDGSVFADYTALVGGYNTYSSCPIKDKYYINEKLTIPTIPGPIAEHDSMVLNNNLRVIDVPKASASDPASYDYYIKGIKFENNSVLVVRMPHGGRLTRIFVGEYGLDMGSAHPKIRIVYMNENATWNGSWGALPTYNANSKEWSATNATVVQNEDYSGNLLIYTGGNLSWGALVAQDSMEGTFISSQEIYIKQHMTLAGQLLANTVKIDAQFDGTGFRFVPFDPDTLDPTALAKGRFPENGEDVEVPIQLDSNAQVDVHFKYCFDVDMNQSGYANKNDFNITQKAKFPICSKGERGSVMIPMNSLVPSADTKVYINVAKDTDKEGDEKLVLRIYDLTGAVMPGDTLREGAFELTIVDMNGPEFNDKVSSYNVNENTAATTVFATIPIKNVDVAAADIDNFKLIVDGSDATAAKSLFNFELVKKAIKNSDVYDTAYIVMSVKTADLNYEELTKTSFKLTFRLDDNGTISDSTTRTINVIDVNEKPAVSDTTFSIKENPKKNATVGTVKATDPDTKNPTKFGHLEYVLVDTSVPFNVGSSTGVITVRDSTKLDYEALKDQDYKFTFDVKVKNCEQASNGAWTLNCLDTISHVIVKVLDVNEPPHIIDDGHDLEVDENTPSGTLVFDVTTGGSAKIEVVDVDGIDDASKLSVTLVGIDNVTGKPTAEELFKTPIHPTEDPATGKMVLVVAVNDASLLDYETVKSYYTVKLIVTDHDGAKDSVTKKLVVNDVNEAPEITGVRGLNDGFTGTTREDFTLYPKENLGKNASVGVVQAKDPDTKNVTKYGHLEYRIIPDASNPVPFTMKGGTGYSTDSTIYVSDSTKMNHEDGIVYSFKVETANCLKNASTGKYTQSCLYDTALVTVKIQNVPEDPKIQCYTGDTNCNGPYDVKENTALNTLVHAFQIVDPDKDQAKNMDSVWLADRKSGGKAGDYFKAVTSGDSLKIVVKSNINYETIKDTIYNVRVTIKDKDGKTAYIDRTINIVDVNEKPAFASKDTTISVKENTPNKTVVGSLPATDPDIKHVREFGHLEYSIIDRVAKNIPFDMESNKIVVTDVSRLDYEALQPTAKFSFYVQVANCELNTSTNKYTGACLYDTAKVTLSVTDEPEKTEIIPDCKGDSCTVCTGPDCHDIVDSLCKGPNCTGVHTHDSVLTLAVKENVPTGYKIIDYLVSDEDVGTGHKDTLVASFKNTNKSGADSLFKIAMVKVGGQWRVVVSVKDGSKLDYEKVKDKHAITIYVSDPDDPAGMGDSIRRIIEVVDVNEAPKAKDADLKPEENLPKGTVIGKLDVSEPDTKHVREFGHLEYSIIGKDSTFAFVMDSNKVKVNDPSKMDYELAVHKYVFNVLISNCEFDSTSGKYDGACLYDTAKVTVDIQDVNEKPKIIIDGPVPDGDDDSDTLCVAVCDTTDRGVKSKDSILTIGVRENPDNPNGTKKIITPTGMILFQYHVADEDTNHATGAKVTWFDAGSSISSVSKKGSDLFTIAYDSVKHVITVRVKDEKLLDYEALRNATSRNDPDPEYTMGIVVTDPKGLADTLYRKIRVTDENEKPLFDVWPLVITENNKINDSLGHVEHPSDIDSMSRNPDLYDNGFKMTGGDTSLFWLDKDSTDLMRVMIRANVVLDCENGQYTCGQDSMYWVYMTYGDTTLRTVYTDLKIPVKLIDLDEAPVVLTDTIGVDENSPKGTVVDTIKWSDVDRFDTVMTFKIAKDPTGCFEIDNITGEITVKKNKCAGLDYEKNPTVKIDVAITDMVNVPDSLYDDNCKCQLISAKNGPITTTKTIVVNIHDINEPPSISDKTIAVPESTTVWSVIDTVKATDPDKKKEFSQLTYTIVDGDSAVFQIDPKTGVLVLKDTLDYESKKDYVIYVQVDDGEFADTAKVKINVTNVPEYSKVIITQYDNVDSTWTYPDTVYTNVQKGVLTWRQDDEIVSVDTTLKKGKNVIIITYKDPKKDFPGKDTVVIMYNNDVPSVEVSAKIKHIDAENVFTIVENTGEKDSTIYVNQPRDSVFVHVKDAANKRDTSFALEVDLEPVNVSNALLNKMSSIADSKLMLDETPTGPVTRALVNDSAVKVSYNQVVGNDTVTVSYMLDKNGEPILVPVTNEKGKTQSREIITVTYKTKIGKREVELSYQADAMTGEILAKGPSGELMVQGASTAKYSTKKCKKDSTCVKNPNVGEGIFTVTTTSIDKLGSPTVVSYAIDEKGNMVKNAEGDIGYSVTYTYKNIYGNFAIESVFIVLDQTFPVVEILSPGKGQVIRSNYVEVVWTVNGVKQDTLTMQGLEKGLNPIVRFFRDKAGNEASDTVAVIMKDSKSVDISVVNPVTEMDKEKVEEYYADHAPKKGQTFAVSIKNPTTEEEVETLIGGSFKTKKGSGKEPYPGKDTQHLGPTLAMDIKLPVVYGVRGLATMDDLMTSDGMIPLEGVDAKNSHKISAEEYVEKYCEDGTKVPTDFSQFNLYDSKLSVKIWVYTSLGNFVDYFSFKQDLNDPTFTDDAGLLQMYFEQKPDKDGYVKADNGKLYATGAYVYKVEASLRSKLRCTLPASDYSYEQEQKTGDGFSSSAKRKGDVVKNSDDLLKSFGYRRPRN